MPGENSIISVALTAAHDGWRLDRALAAAIPTMSRERLKSLVRMGALTRADGSALRDPATKMRGEESFALELPAPTHPHNEPQEIAFGIAYED